MYWFSQKWLKTFFFKTSTVHNNYLSSKLDPGPDPDLQVTFPDPYPDPTQSVSGSDWIWIRNTAPKCNLSCCANLLIFIIFF
jgi:hypothetical protein